MQEKNLFDLKSELESGINTKYGPFVKLLNNKEIFDKINDAIANYRVELINKLTWIII